MFDVEATPTPYHHKLPMSHKNYDIFFNQDYDLTEIELNQHNYYEFYFLVTGSVTYIIEDRKYFLSSGDIVLISPNQLHSASIDASVPYKRYVLWLSINYLDNLSSKNTKLSNIFKESSATGQQIKLSHELLLEVSRLFKNIFINSRAQKYGADLLANSYITELLVLLAQASLFCSEIMVNHSHTESQINDSSLVSMALKYIENHVLEPILISEICRHCFVSRSHLSKTFTKELGIPLHQYIIKKKLFLAKSDIADGLHIQEIAEKYSFNSYSSFYKAFCKEFGQSPNKFKKEVEHSDSTI